MTISIPKIDSVIYGVSAETLDWCIEEINTAAEFIEDELLGLVLDGDLRTIMKVRHAALLKCANAIEEFKETL
ncbi:hypothetical protein SFC07_11150 [Corynebacterium callunae]|uniref:hypothetical protein n=1 Tax=Corynebacterium callunae TaxID=1721 RepID=UPI003981CF6A